MIGLQARVARHPDPQRNPTPAATHRSTPTCACTVAHRRGVDDDTSTPAPGAETTGRKPLSTHSHTWENSLRMTAPTGPPRGPHGPPPSATTPYGAPPPSAAPPPRSGGSAVKVLLIALLAVLLIAGGATAALVLTRDDEAAATEVTLEPTGSTGENPFMASVGEDEPDVEPPPESGGTYPGDTAGIYGGTTDESSCDPGRMVAFLESHPAEAETWAGVVGVEVSQIASYVDTLTPVVLRSDTAVTNHGFSGTAASKSGGRPDPVDGGVATSFQAVLQAGTAVLVDTNGVPAVKCGCGNPLLPPERTSRARYRGARWPGFDQDRITIVEASTVQISILILIDVQTGNSFGRPIGTRGGQDGPAPDDDQAPDDGPATATTDAPSATTAAPPEGPVDGTYSVSVSGTCQGVSSFTLTVSGSSVTFDAAGQTFSGTIEPDGSFSISDATGGISGRFVGDTVSGDLRGSDGCTGTFQGQRTG